MHTRSPDGASRRLRSRALIVERLWTCDWQCSQKRRFSSPAMTSQLFGQGFDLGCFFVVHFDVTIVSLISRYLRMIVIFEVMTPLPVESRRG